VEIIYGDNMYLDRDGRWVARAAYVERQGDLVPVGVEVRLVPRPGAPVDWTQPATHIDEQWVPEGGLSVATLRNIVWHDRTLHAGMAVTELLGELFVYDEAAVLEHLQLVTADAVELGLLRRGRRDLTRSLFALVMSTPEGFAEMGSPSREATINRVQRHYPGFTSNELRSTLAWARGHEPPLFTNSGHGRAGGFLTRHAQRILQLRDPLLRLDEATRHRLEEERAL
jgi:hypothetical protein